MRGQFPDDLHRLLYELQLHKLEFEMQCQQLRQSRFEMEGSRSKYQELYESIPVGYATIEPSGQICDLNPAGFQLLGLEPGRPLPNFHMFLTKEDLNEFVLVCREALADNRPCMADLSLLRPADGARVSVGIDVRPAKTRNVTARLRIVFQDIMVRSRTSASNGEHSAASLHTKTESQGRLTV